MPNGMQSRDVSVDINNFKGTAPVADEHLSFSKYGARGSIDKSLLLPSDAEQMLRVRLSMPQSRENELTRSRFLTSLREEADVMPQCVFDELCKQYPNIMQLLRI